MTATRSFLGGGSVRSFVTRRAVLGAAALIALLAFGTTAQAQILPLNKCLAGKLGCVAKKKACLLKCYSKALGAGIPVDTACLTKCRVKFDGGADPTKGCFAKLEAKPPCVTTGDTAQMECKVEAFVRDVVEELVPGFQDPLIFLPLNTCTAGKVKCVSKKNKCLLKVYAKAAKAGGAPDATKLAKCTTKFDGGIDPTKGCFAKLEAKPPCLTNGDTASMENKDDAFVQDVLAELMGGGVLDSQRCTGDTRVHCTTTVPDCLAAGGTCEFFFGSNLPLSAGGVATCVTNQFNGTISGTADVNTGSSAGTASLISRVYSGPTVDHPCPRCIGDAFANDGVQGGTCDSGNHPGEACDVSGSAVNPNFGDTSLDCPPLSGALIAALPIDLTNTTGVRSKTLSAASPNCRAIGFTGLKCFCDTCNNLAATPCSTNADCGAGICGGKRCIGGGNAGAPCTSSTECPGGACSVPGQATAPNQCDDAICTPNTGPDFDSCNEGVCAAGPFEQFCGPVATYQGCITNADCTTPGDTCSIAKFRECYTDNGAVGATVQACGHADPPVNHCDRPRLASLYCIAPTAAGSVNAVAGLPGLGRLELPGRALENGTASTCPSKINFTPVSRSPILDNGWTGQSHDAAIVSGGLVTVNVSGCAGAAPNCGVCTYNGPIPNPGP